MKSENKLITEYYYRLARVSQALNDDYFEVIKKFEKVLSINNNDNLYVVETLLSLKLIHTPFL